MNEFDLIARHFSGHHKDALLGVGDDAALVEVNGATLAVATDTLVADVHFPISAPAQSIGHRALAVNLSDLAAMGARPRWFTLALTMPDFEPAWLEDFSRGMLALAERAQIGLIGGDTTRGPLTTTVTVIGDVAQPLTRDGASVGDQIWIGGRPGDAAGGLACWPRRGVADANVQTLVQRFLYPEPQIELGQSLRGRASAAIDVSDGLVADLGHICAASGCGAVVHTERLPISESLQNAVGRSHAEQLALAGGDDYVLLFTAPAGARFDGCTPIGEINSAEGVTVLSNGQPRAMQQAGYAHF